MIQLQTKQMYRVGKEIVTVFTDGRSFLVGLFNTSNVFYTLKQAYNAGKDCKVFKTSKETVSYLFDKYHPEYSK